MKAGKTKAQLIDQMNRNSPVAAEAKVGSCIDDLITQFNAFLAKVDTANVTGIGNNNVATFGITPIDKR